jgi:hypothetical protein
MEIASKLRWVVIVAVTILITILIGWGLFSLVKNLFEGVADRREESAEIDSDAVVTNASTARFIVNGPVVAPEEQRSYTIEVSQGVVSMTVYKNFGQQVIDKKTYANNAASYNAFLNALSQEGVTERKDGTDEQDDYAELGVCANGRQYIVEIDTAVRRWSTSCSSSQGTAGFNMSRVQTLYRNQVPDYSELVSGTGL